MYVEIDEQQRQMIVELIESRIRELHPTIRRSRVSACTDSLKEDLSKLEQGDDIAAVAGGSRIGSGGESTETNCEESREEEASFNG